MKPRKDGQHLDFGASLARRWKKCPKPRATRYSISPPCPTGWRFLPEWKCVANTKARGTMRFTACRGDGNWRAMDTGREIQKDGNVLIELWEEDELLEDNGRIWQIWCAKRVHKHTEADADTHADTRWDRGANRQPSSTRMQTQICRNAPERNGILFYMRSTPQRLWMLGKRNCLKHGC